MTQVRITFAFPLAFKPKGRMRTAVSAIISMISRRTRYEQRVSEEQMFQGNESIAGHQVLVNHLSRLNHMINGNGSLMKKNVDYFVFH